MTSNIFSGCIPALMTPCKPDRTPDFDALVRKGKELIAKGMSAVVYCGSMGDWPLLSDEERMAGVEALAKAGVPVVVGTGAVNTKIAAAHAAHAQKVGAKGLMVIPRVLSRGSSISAQKAHFKAILAAAPDLPAVIYITSADDNVTLMVGVDTGVFHGFVNCGATGAITGIGNVLPKEVQHLVALSKAAAKGDVEARKLALELEAALDVLSSFDEGPDLVLFYKHMMVLTGNPEYELHFNETDKLSDSQRGYCETQLKLFQTWYADWLKQGSAAAKYAA